MYQHIHCYHLPLHQLKNESTLQKTSDETPHPNLVGLLDSTYEKQQFHQQQLINYLSPEMVICNFKVFLILQDELVW